MRFKTFLVLSFIVALAALPAFSQTVTITGKKQVFTRKKPIVGFKKTFLIRKPIAAAATPELSKKITAALDPISVLGIDLQEELTESQWLNEADFTEVFNQDGVITVEIWMEGSGAYTDGVIKYVVVDLTTGKRAYPSDLFVNIPGLLRAAKAKQDAIIAKSIEDIKKNAEFGDGDPTRLFEYANFEEKDLENVSVDMAGVAFFYDYGFPTAVRSLEPDSEIRFSWKEIVPFINSSGLLVRFIR